MLGDSNFHIGAPYSPKSDAFWSHLQHIPAPVRWRKALGTMVPIGTMPEVSKTISGASFLIAQ